MSPNNLYSTTILENLSVGLKVAGHSPRMQFCTSPHTPLPIFAFKRKKMRIENE